MNQFLYNRPPATRAATTLSTGESQNSYSGELSILRLLAVPTEDAPGCFDATLDGSDELVVQGSRQPLTRGARALLAKGVDGATPIVLRHKGSLHDATVPKPVQWWAGWTYWETETEELRRVKYVPFAGVRKRRKSGATDGPATILPARRKPPLRPDRTLPPPPASLGLAA